MEDRNSGDIAFTVIALIPSDWSLKLAVTVVVMVCSCWMWQLQFSLVIVHLATVRYRQYASVNTALD